MTFVRAAWVIQVLLPVTRQSSPSFTARVRKLPRSEPVLGSVKTAVGRVSPEASSGEPFGFLLFGAAAHDQLGRDFGAGAERADADVAARQFFGDYYHGGFGQAKAAVLFGDGQAEDAHFGQFGDDLHRNEFVFEVPFVGIRDDFFICEAAELVADHFQFFVETGDANGRGAIPFQHQFDQARTSGL